MASLPSGKGQESAPFELLIAVIVMAFVMLFGYRAMEEMKIKDCEARIGQEMEKMRTAIESTTNQGSLEKIHFEIPQCFKDSRVRLNAVRNKVVCSSICQEGRNECISLDFWSDIVNNRVCVNIPMYTEFERPPGNFCEDRSAKTPDNPIPYDLTPFMVEDVGVPNGSYILINKTPPAWKKPVVCAYRMK